MWLEICHNNCLADTCLSVDLNYSATGRAEDHRELRRCAFWTGCLLESAEPLRSEFFAPAQEISHLLHLGPQR